MEEEPRDMAWGVLHILKVPQSTSQLLSSMKNYLVISNPNITELLNQTQEFWKGPFCMLN